MARIDLHNFFKFYDEKNPNHVKAVQWLEDNLPVKYLEDNVDWAEIYRGKKTSAAPAPAAAAAPVTGGDDVPQMGIKLIKEFERVLAKLKAKIGDTNTDMVRSRTAEKHQLNLYSELDTVYKMLQAPEPLDVIKLRQQLVYWLDKWDKDQDLDARDHYPEWTEFLSDYGYKKV